jgi:hypothetical protein
MEPITLLISAVLGTAGLGTLLTVGLQLGRGTRYKRSIERLTEVLATLPPGGLAARAAARARDRAVLQLATHTLVRGSKVWGIVLTILVFMIAAFIVYVSTSVFGATADANLIATTSAPATSGTDLPAGAALDPLADAASDEFRLGWSLVALSLIYTAFAVVVVDRAVQFDRRIFIKRVEQHPAQLDDRINKAL